MRALSVSSIRLYDRCPAAFRFRYVDRIPEEPTAPMRIGSSVHRVIAATLLAMNVDSSGEITPEHHAIRALEAERARVPLDLFPAVERIAKTWAAEARFDFRGVSTLWTEKRIEIGAEFFAAMPGEDVRFVGILDRVDFMADGSARVVDYKATYRIRPLSEVEEDFQLRAYGWLLRRMGHAGPVSVAFAFPAYGGTERKVDLGLDDFADVRRVIEAKETQIRGDSKWEARVGDACTGCSYRSRCPAFAAALAENRLPLVTEETAAGVARAWRARRKFDEEVEAALKVYAEGRPIVDPTTGAVIAEFTTRRETSIPDAAKAARVLKANGVSDAGLWQAVRISKTAFESAAKKAGLPPARVAGLLEEVAVEDVGTVFSWKEKGR